MGSKPHHSLHFIFFPIMWKGHLIPMLNMAKLFALRGARVGIVATPHSESPIRDATQFSSNQITVHLLHFPPSAPDLPDPDSTTPSEDIVATLVNAFYLLQQPFESLLQAHLPDCLISDFFLPWTAASAAKFDVLRLTFSGSSFFSFCAIHSFNRYSPHLSAKSDTEPFLIPNLPHAIELTRSQLSELALGRGPLVAVSAQMREAALRSPGAVVNSFYELEPDYVHYYKKEITDKVWHVGPVSLCNMDRSQAQRYSKASVDPSQCLDWLDSKPPASVLYVCFGSMSRLSTPQLAEIAWALDGSGRPFIWVIRGAPRGEWAPEGFEESTRDKGLIIDGWAQQVTILNHPAVGGFVTHCGWNSILEGVSAGVPMVTWPMFAEQFYNEQFVTRVVRIGVEVGVTVWAMREGENAVAIIGREKIERAVVRVMDNGDEASEMRRRAKELSMMAKLAMEEGGSSYTGLTQLMEEIKINSRKSKLHTTP